MIRALLVPVLVAAVVAGPARGDEPDAKKAVGDFSKRMTDTMVKGDAAALTAMLADDWRFTGPEGTHDKASVLAGIKAGTLKYLVMDKSKLEVRVYGDAAVVTGHGGSGRRSRSTVTGSRRTPACSRRCSSRRVESGNASPSTCRRPWSRTASNVVPMPAVKTGRTTRCT